MTDQERKAMEMALEALGNNQPVNYCQNNNGERFPMFKEDPFRFDCNSKAIEALRQALNVDAIDTSSTYVDKNKKRKHEGCAECGKKASEGWALYCVKCTELFAQPWDTSDMAYRPNGLSVEQEPVAYLCENATGHRYFRWKKPAREYNPIPLYTAPPSKHWVSLTFEDVAELGFEIGDIDTDRDLYRFALAIEAALKEKNT